MDSWTNATARTGRRTTTDAGILRPDLVGATYSLNRSACHPDLAGYIEHYWAVEWRLPEVRTQQSRVLSHPAVHMSFEEGSGNRHGLPLPAGLVHGVPTRRFELELSGHGRVLGVKFRPGGFAAMTGQGVETLTDKVLELGSVWPAASALGRRVLAEPQDLDRCAVLDGFLLGKLPATPDPRYELVLAIVADALADRTITTVEQVAARHNIGLRTLQRLARHYIGVGAKWLIQRFRLHDAVTDLQTDPHRDLAELAHELGWYDQAHFTRDFTSSVGISPARYARQQQK